MSEQSIPAVSRCDSYRPGHSTHWMQARLTRSQPVPPVEVEVLAVDDTYVVVAAEHGVRRFWNHDVPRVGAIVDQHGPAGTLVGHHVLQLGDGHMICVQEDSEGPPDPCVATDVSPS